MAMTTGIIKICDSGILQPLSIIFCNALNSGIFPESQKHSRIVLVHSKENKQLMQHCPVSLAGSSKIFERLIFNSPYKSVKITVCSVPINLDLGKQIHVSIIFCL